MKSIVAELSMSKLPDFEGLAMFAKVAEERSFAAAARATGVSVATVSRAVARFETLRGSGGGGRLRPRNLEQTPRSCEARRTAVFWRPLGCAGSAGLFPTVSGRRYRSASYGRANRPDRRWLRCGASH